MTSFSLRVGAVVVVAALLAAIVVGLMARTKLVVKDPWYGTPSEALGCGRPGVDHGVALRLAVAGESPWCGDSLSGGETYRLLWGHRATPTVVTVTPLGDSAMMHVVGIAHVDERGREQPALDTTFAIAQQRWRWLRLEFASATRSGRVVPPLPADGERSIWVLEGRRDGIYRGMIGWPGRDVYHSNAFLTFAKDAGILARVTGVK